MNFMYQRKSHGQYQNLMILVGGLSHAYNLRSIIGIMKNFATYKFQLDKYVCICMMNFMLFEFSVNRSYS